MGWATGYIAKLRAGETVSFRPRGPGRLHGPADRVRRPLHRGARRPGRPLRAGDIVLCKVRGAEFLHLVKAVQGGRFQIGNNRGHVNDWIGPSAIYGRLVKVER